MWTGRFPPVMATHVSNWGNFPVVEADLRSPGGAGQMARRLAEAEERRASTAIDLSALRRLEVKQVLGVEGPLTGGEIGQIRRQFATVFHSDRVKRLPAWVGRLFDELLGVVNEACDRARK